MGNAAANSRIATDVRAGGCRAAAARRTRGRRRRGGARAAGRAGGGRRRHPRSRSHPGRHRRFQGARRGRARARSTRASRRRRVVGVGIADVEAHRPRQHPERHHVGDGAGGRALPHDAEARRRSTATARRTSSARSRTIVKGDARCLSIAAASIIAKVTRDRMMVALAREAPRLRLRAPQGLRHAGASRRAAPARRYAASPPLVRAGAAGAGTRRESQLGRVGSAPAAGRTSR